LTNLVYIDLSENTGLSAGTMPAAAQLPAGLSGLILYSTNRTGAIPDYSSLTSLSNLSIRMNQLSGNLPDFSLNTSLLSIDVSNNDLTGTLPTAAQLPTGLRFLVLANNELTGTIPDYSTLTSLERIDLKGNTLSGSLPAVSQLPASLVFLEVANTQLTGSIPDYSSLTAMTRLDVGLNQLTGPLPLLSELPAGLVTLYLYSNQFTGEILDYSSIDPLGYLSVNNMNVQGPTPAGLLAWGGMGWFTTTPVIDPALDGAGRQSARVIVSGTGAESGGTVEVFVNGLSVVTGIEVDALGTWSTNVDLSGYEEDTTYRLTAITHFDSWPGHAADSISGVTSTAVNITIDNTAPVITLTGSETQSIEAGTSYTDQGATVSDNFDTGLTATLSGSVDINTAGTYTLVYNATDSAGNAATPVERTVTVTKTSSGGSGGGFNLGFLLLVLAVSFFFPGGQRRHR
jgi:hypothetical protein